MNTNTDKSYLGFDIGGSKVAWGLVSEEGKLLTSGRYHTPADAEAFMQALVETIEAHPATAVGIGIAGTLSSDRHSTALCTNIPSLSNFPLVDRLAERFPDTVFAMDNDARCALIGEVWLGAAQELSSAVMITIGTGIGGAVMRRGIVRPHPQDIGQEVGRISVDPSDVFPSKSGRGSVESFIGGRNLQERLQIELAHESEAVRTGDQDSKEVWHAISYFFIQCIQAIYGEYHCDTIIVGGVGSRDLDHYLQDPAPCKVIAAKLGEEAGIYGAGRLAIDAYQESLKDWE
ncbi:MAG: ROK family protein [bacterium]